MDSKIDDTERDIIYEPDKSSDYDSGKIFEAET